jgi:hypothetical protein
MSIPDYLRDRAIPTFESKESDDPMAVIFVVNDTKEHPVYENDVFVAATAALMELLTSVNPDVQENLSEWLNGRIRKLVKRARNKAWDDTIEASENFAQATFGSATVRVFPPVHFSEMPPSLKKLQVTGLESEKQEIFVDPNFTGLEITVDSRLGMSTGKTVAQVNHVAQLFLMDGEIEKVEEWQKRGFPTRFKFSDEIASSPFDIQVQDAGFTEIPAGSRTAIGLYLN